MFVRFISDTAYPAQQTQPGLRDCTGPITPFIAFTKEASEQSLLARFEQQVRQYPHKVALKSTQRSLTYAELQQEAHRVAQAILAVRGHDQEPIALLFEPDTPLITAILGILQAGKIYVPLDPTFPSARNAAMLADSQASMIVTNSRNLAAATALAQHGEAVLNTDELTTDPMVRPLGAGLSPDDLACVLYTSGSTGRPKGVMHSHRTILHGVARYTQSSHINTDDRLLLLSSSSTMGGTLHIWSTILNGATLCLFDVKMCGLHQLPEQLHREAITIYTSVTTLFRQFCSILTSAERFPQLRLVRLFGEAVTRKDVELFQRHCPLDCLLYLNLASTETGGGVREFFVDHATQLTGSTVPAGYAVEDMEILILEDNGALIEDGSIGEIAVKSRYLAVGYWRQPDLTHQAFVPDPAGSEARIYRTGDLGRLLPDGCLECLGRKDFQVKVRGYRVETAEIELALLEHEAVQEAVVVAQQEQTDETRLVAYVVPAQRPGPSVSVLRSFVQGKLPDYMVPATFVLLDALPLTSTGKVDRRALPSLSTARPALAQPFVAPRTPIEVEIAQLWSTVLGLTQIGVHDHFLDLGGHSLLAMQIVARTHDAWHVDIPLRSLLEAPTVADMALAIMQHLAGQIAAEELDGLLMALETSSGDVRGAPGQDRTP